LKINPSLESNVGNASKYVTSIAKMRGSIIGKILVLATVVIAGLGIILGCLSLSLNSLDSYPIPLLVLLGILMACLFVYTQHIKREKQWGLIIFAGLSFISAYILRLLPTYLYGFQINGIIHRSFISALLLLALTVPSFCYGLYHMLGATPKAHDLSRYPIIMLPIVLILIAYGILLYRVFNLGVGNLSWHILITPFEFQDWSTIVWQNNWPTWVPQSIHQPGLSNYIMGTLLLIGMTSVISIPLGVAVGIYVTERSKGKLAKTIKFSCTTLKSISVFVLGLTAMTLVRDTYGTFLANIFAGFYYDIQGNRHIASGSFFTAALIISLLVIPIIARATEEGILSSPSDLKEGSLSLGASNQYTLSHILIPWALPNIVTGWLLGCAETAGSLATIWFISGTGQYGTGPFNSVTSLSYFIYFVHSDIDMNFKSVEGIYQYSAAVILIIIAVALSIAAVIIKGRLQKRYR